MVKIIFLHPDLGIGGAERLVVDAALAFKTNGHDVSFYTNHYNPNHSFAETRDFLVTVVGEWLPRSIFGRLKAVCAYTRMTYAALYLTWCVIPDNQPTLIFCDQISLCIPFLKVTRKPIRILFYCHHPDKLLTAEGGILKKLYRLPLNWLEERTTSQADKVLVNSKYTADVFQEAFQTIKDIPNVCYPSINTEFYKTVEPKLLEYIIPNAADKFIFLSINRYERKKNLQLAIRALMHLKYILGKSNWSHIHLVMAGGYDPVNLENRDYYTELTDLATELDLANKVTFMKSPSDAEKVSLLYHCRALIYTPSKEHFGIVPLEAMYFGKPVVAVNNGGPTETIVHNETGFLCEPHSECFANAMSKLVISSGVGKKLGEAGRKRFNSIFSLDAFKQQLNNILVEEMQMLSETGEL